MKKNIQKRNSMQLEKEKMFTKSRHDIIFLNQLLAAMESDRSETNKQRDKNDV